MFISYPEKFPIEKVFSIEHAVGRADINFQFQEGSEAF
jgi:hypothetical protein